MKLANYADLFAYPVFLLETYGIVPTRNVTHDTCTPPPLSLIITLYMHITTSADFFFVINFSQVYINVLLD